MTHEIREKARKKVRSIKRLYIHCALFAIMSVFFFALNVLTDPFDMWFFFPILPWSAIVAFHFVLVKGIPGSKILSKEWEEEELERQMDLLQEQTPYSTDRFLPYSELNELETLKLRKLQSETHGNLNEDFV
ncbi:MAG: hypothetical protein ACI9FN_001224 [Saprospiraceae bacterium]|jgi:hypothetical protein